MERLDLVGGAVTIDAAAGTSISNQGTFRYDGDGNGTNESMGVTDAFACD